jgi:hypothetical protein
MVAAGMTTTRHAGPTALAQSSDAAPERGQALSGILRTEEGHTLAHTEVLACSSTVCFFAESGSNGRFRFDLPASPASYVIKTVEEVSMSPRRAAALVPIRLSGRAALDVGPVYVPSLPELTAVLPGQDPQTLRPGDGLELTLSRMDLQVAPGKVLLGVAARRIPLDQAPAYRLPAHETVVAVFAVYPLGATSRSPIPVRAPSTLAKGTPVRFRSVDDIDGTLSAPVPGRATGTHVVTDGSAGITRLTHVVITTVSQ